MAKGIGQDALLGGSEAAAALGLDPYMSQYELWLIKTGRKERDREVSGHMKRGIALEGMVADLYKKQTGRKLRRVSQVEVCKQFHWRIGHVDRLVMKDARGPGVFEAKCPGWHGYNKAKREGIQKSTLIQVLHYLSLGRYSWAVIVLFDAQSWEFLPFEINADDHREAIESLIVAERQFMECVFTDQPPEQTRDQANVEATLATFGGTVMECTDDDWKGLVQDFRVAKAMKDEANLADADVRERMKAFISGHEVSAVQGHGMRVYHRIEKGGGRYDTKALFADHPEIDAQKYYTHGKDKYVLRPYILKEREV